MWTRKNKATQNKVVLCKGSPPRKANSITLCFLKRRRMWKTRRQNLETSLLQFFLIEKNNSLSQLLQTTEKFHFWFFCQKAKSNSYHFSAFLAADCIYLLQTSRFPHILSVRSLGFANFCHLWSILSKEPTLSQNMHFFNERKKQVFQCFSTKLLLDRLFRVETISRSPQNDSLNAQAFESHDYGYHVDRHNNL